MKRFAKERGGHTPAEPLGIRGLVRMIPRRRVVAAAALGVVLAGLNLVQPAAVGALIAAITEGREAIGWTILLATAVLTAALVGAAQAISLSTTGEILVRGVRRSLIETVLLARIPALANVSSGDLVSRVGAEAGALKIFVTQGVAGVVTSAPLAVGAVVCMAVVSAPLLATASVVIALSLFAITRLSRSVQRAATEQQSAIGLLSADVERMYTAVRLIRLTGTEHQETTRIDARLSDAETHGRQVGRVLGFIAPLSNTIFQAALIVTLAVGGAFVGAGWLGLEGFVAFLLYLFMALAPLNQMFSAAATVAQVRGTLVRLSDVLDLPRESFDATNKSASNPTSSARESPLITFDRVTVTHTEPGRGSTRALEEVSCSIARRGMTVIVGQSGAGKSTLLAGAYGFVDEYEGRIRLNGQDLRRVPRSEITRTLSVVEQGSPLIEGSIFENVALGNPDLSKTSCLELIASLGLSHLAPTVAALDRPVGDRGVKVSGGERQRLAIARAVASDAPMLVLDEATAHLDSVNERTVLDVVRHRWAERGVLIVTHRIALSAAADHVIVLDKGRIVVEGEHHHCLRASPEYAALYAAGTEVGNSGREPYATPQSAPRGE